MGQLQAEADARCLEVAAAAFEDLPLQLWELVQVPLPSAHPIRRWRAVQASLCVLFALPAQPAAISPGEPPFVRGQWAGILHEEVSVAVAQLPLPP